MQKYKLAIVEDNELYRTSLRIAISQSNKYEIVWVAPDGLEAIKNFQKSCPDLIFMDIEMPNLGGVETVARIKSQSPNTKIIMLTAHDEIELVLSVLKSGADAYCTKEISIERLLEVTSMVLDGATWFDPAISAYIYQFIQQANLEKANTVNLRFDLSNRELQVLQLMTEGKSNKEIAHELAITIHTVKAHVCNIIQKLSAKDRTEASVKAMKYGIL